MISNLFRYGLLPLVWLLPTTLGAGQLLDVTVVRDEIDFKVVGEFRPTRGAAKESVLEEAREALRGILRDRGLQRFVLPPTEWIERELYVRETSVIGSATVMDESLTRFTAQFKIKPTHMRMFRKMERTSLSAMVVGSLIVVFLVGWLYYRLDEWTKGYLTSYLAAGLALAGVIVAGVWWWLYT